MTSLMLEISDWMKSRKVENCLKNNIYDKKNNDNQIYTIIVILNTVLISRKNCFVSHHARLQKCKQINKNRAGDKIKKKHIK